MMNKKVSSPIICVMGPTASGKSALALKLAQDLRGEIVSVDSANVYRGMNIGTAKPNATERTLVPHHLLDLIEPSQAYSAAQFCADAQAAMAAIHARGNTPILVGGTMLYFKALFEGLHDLPAANAQVRADLEAQAALHGWPDLHARLMQIDATTASRLKPHDAQRIGRALEVWQLSGKTLSAHFAEQKTNQSASNTRYLKIALEPSQRALLHERIAQRFQTMLQAGFVEEVRHLRTHLLCNQADFPNLPALRCVGYRQAWHYLEGTLDYDNFVEQSIAATRQLCKRQLTWLRSMPDRTVFDCLQPNLSEQVLQYVHENILSTQ